MNFDPIYNLIFNPAIESVQLPEGGTLVPRRTDMDFFAGDIGLEMFGYLEYSRFAIADITGLNANVFYELGVRHRTREAGTAVFRQTGSTIPFDIRSIKAFDYDYEPIEKAAESRALIADVLTNSLMRNRLDSPVQIALRAQRDAPNALDNLLLQAENDIRNQNWSAAMRKYQTALRMEPRSVLIRQRLGLFFKDRGRWKEALEQFNMAVATSPEYAEAWRERGIAENKLYEDLKKEHGQEPDAPRGEESLLRAIELDADDFDARASLGGVLKREGRYAEALDQYQAATRVSNGHAYPLLNEIKLEGRVTGKITMTPQRDIQLRRAELARRNNAAADPPIDAPWCFFDLSEMRLYRGEVGQALDYLDRGIDYSQHAWQPGSHRASMQLLRDGGVKLDGLDEVISRLRTAEQVLL